MAENSLAVVEQRDVVFYDDTIIAVRVEDGTVYVPIRPICDLLGIDYSGQIQRIDRDTVLSESKGVCVIQTPGGPQPMQCLNLNATAGFLFGISENRIRPALKERLLRYKRECYRVLSEAFQEGRLTADATFTDLLSTDSPAAQAYKMAQAIMQMARQQLLLESRVDSAETRLDEYGNRIETLEATLGDTRRHISAAQASTISQAVKAISLELGRRSGRNEFGGVYGELYRRFAIAGYRELPAAKYDEALNFLREWYQAVTDTTDTPF